MERRFLSRKVDVIKRADGGESLTGYAAVFFRAGEPGTEYELWPGLRERIMPAAFDRALADRDDVRALFNHNDGFILGRTAAGTLRLSKDDVGLRYEIDVPATTAGKDVLESVRRGDLSGSSFSFTKPTEMFVPGDPFDVVEIHSVGRLWDVGPVVFPAYEATTAAARCAEGTGETHSAWAAWKKRRADFLAGVSARARQVTAAEKI